MTGGMHDGGRDAVRRLRATLEAHRPADDTERRSLARTLAELDRLETPFDRDADPTHVTGSAIVVDQRGRVLLHRHRLLERWLQPGGHLDPGETPADAAVRETLEESGLVASHPVDGPTLIHVDVHDLEVLAAGISHVHLDLRYLLHADGDVLLAPAPGESPEVQWFTIEHAASVADDSAAAAVAAARRHLA